MAGFDYARSRATAARLIERFGQTGQIRRTFYTSPANPADPSSGTQETLDYDVTLVATDYTLRERESSLIEAGDRKVLVSAPVTIPARTDSDTNPIAGTSDKPDLADRIVIDAVPHEIIDIAPLNPGGTLVLWALQCRR